MTGALPDKFPPLARIIPIYTEVQDISTFVAPTSRAGNRHPEDFMRWKPNLPAVTRT